MEIKERERERTTDMHISPGKDRCQVIVEVYGRKGGWTARVTAGHLSLAFIALHTQECAGRLGIQIGARRRAAQHFKDGARKLSTIASDVFYHISCPLLISYVNLCQRRRQTVFSVNALFHTNSNLQS